MTDDDEGGGIGVIGGIIITMLAVATIIVIVIPSINKSGGGIIAYINEKLGLSTGKAEASTIKSDECNIKRYYWSKDKVKVGEPADIVIEGAGNCDGKNVRIDVFNDISFWPDKQLRSVEAPFKESKISVNWPTNAKGRYYFTIKFGDYTSPESKRLEIA